MIISLVMAVQNPEKVKQYLSGALVASLLFDEVIVHSNTPSENKWIPSYSNLKIISDEAPINVYEAYNKAIAQAKGDWILPICADDIVDFNAIAKTLSEIRNGIYNNKDIVYSTSFDGNEVSGWKRQPSFTNSFSHLREYNAIPFASFYKKKVWEEVRGYKNFPYCDWVFWLEASKKGKIAFEIDRPYYYWRINHTNELSASAQETIKYGGWDKIREQILTYIDSY